jgi:hypothetical protein
MQKDGIDPSKTKETVGLLSQMNQSLKGIIENGNIVEGSLKAIKKSATEVVDQVSLFDDGLIKASRSLGQSVLFAQNLEVGFANVAEKIIKIGGSADDVITLFKSMSNELGRTVSFSETALFNMQLLKQVGVADDSIKSFTKLFDTIGGTFDEATTQQMQLVNQAKSYGLNVSQFMTSVAGQLSKINQYGFPNGVKDLGEMVAKSKLLGGNIEMAAGFADKIMGSPEDALDVAAKLQTLGGSFASLGDPMELLYLAQNDLAGLNDKLMGATKGLATFNKETGQFEIGVNERLRIKQVASAFGTDSKNIIENATKLAKQEQILKELDFTSSLKSLQPEQKEVLASFAQIGKGGKITIEGRDINDFTTTQITEVLKRVQGAGSELQLTGDDAQRKNIEMIQANSSSIEKVIIGQNTQSNSLSLAVIQTNQFRENLEKMANVFAGAVTAVGDFKSIYGGEATTKFNAGVNQVMSDFAGKFEDIVNKIDFPSLKIESVKPIEIKVDTSFQLSDVTKGALKTDLQTFVTNEIERQLNSGKTGAAKPYGSGVKTK